MIIQLHANTEAIYTLKMFGFLTETTIFQIFEKIPYKCKLHQEMSNLLCASTLSLEMKNSRAKVRRKQWMHKKLITKQELDCCYTMANTVEVQFL